MHIRNNSTILLLSIILIIVFSGCKKLTQVGEPVNSVTTSEIFSTDATASSAIIGIYRDIWDKTYFGNGNATFNLGMAADELHFYYGALPFETNTITASSGDADPFWNGAYYDIYLANAAIEALPASNGVSDAVKKQLLGESKFFRAFFHFYLVNLFGDVPLVTSTAYRATDTLHRAPSIQVYQQIIADLKDAQNSLAVDYSVSNGERIRANQFAATALLARVYLYQQRWDSAEAEASKVIENADLYRLLDLNSIFMANSEETILQLQVPNVSPFATQEAIELIPFDSVSEPRYVLRDELLNAFEAGDQRMSAWTGKTNPAGTYYYFPYKYKVRVGDGNVTEYYMLMRLAEQYLIRAEARAQQDKLSDAILDLDTLRERAGLSRLSDLPVPLNQQQTLEAVAQERRVELFCELGQRWLDLKRTGQVDAVLSAIKPTWKPTAALFPIPASELVSDANLTQNPGY